MRLVRGDAPLARWLGVGAAVTLPVLAVGIDAVGAAAPPCALRQVVGLPCPTCGTLRAVQALTEGRIAAATLASPLAVLGVLAVAGWGLAAVAATLRPAWRRRLETAPGERRRLGWALAGLVVANWLWLALR
jgi:hypothetical protein